MQGCAPYVFFLFARRLCASWVKKTARSQLFARVLNCKHPLGDGYKNGVAPQRIILASDPNNKKCDNITFRGHIVQR